MNRYKTLVAASFALVLLAACGSSGNDIGDIYGNGSNRNGTYQLRGTVDSIDMRNQSIYLTNVSGYSSSLNTRGGDSVRVFYDNRTVLSYQGRTYRPDQLERGDEVSVRVDQSGNRLLAQSMDVTYNSSSGMASSSNGTYGSVVHGTVRSVDTYRRTISVDRGYDSTITIEYNSNTRVSLNGRSYSPRDLQAGDEIDIRTNDLGNGRLGAQDITVTRTINGIGSNGGSSSSSPISTIRGTVRSVDSYNRTIDLENSNWVSGFRTNTNTSARFIIHYDPDTNVDYNGQLYPVTNLERGDVVEVQVQNLGSSNYVAQRVVLVRNVR
ncbi:MAG TPA: DUF5666 domain-containing protein [Thermoanaerobaculia bacterium]